MIVWPSHTSGSKIVYTLHVKAEKSGEGPRLRGNSVCNREEDPRIYYDFGCKNPENCNCALCEKQPISLKSLASGIVFGIHKKIKFRFDN